MHYFADLIVLGIPAPFTICFYFFYSSSEMVNQFEHIIPCSIVMLLYERKLVKISCHNIKCHSKELQMLNLSRLVKLWTNANSELYPLGKMKCLVVVRPFLKKKNSFLKCDAHKILHSLNYVLFGLHAFYWSKHHILRHMNLRLQSNTVSHLNKTNLKTIMHSTSHSSIRFSAVQCRVHWPQPYAINLKLTWINGWACCIFGMFSWYIHIFVLCFNYRKIHFQGSVFPSLTLPPKLSSIIFVYHRKAKINKYFNI